MPVIHAEAIALRASQGGVLVVYTSGGEDVKVFIPRNAFLKALHESKNLAGELEANNGEIVHLETGEI